MWSLRSPRVVTFPLLWLCAFPSKYRGGYAIGFVALPLSVEVIVVGLALCLVPLSEEVIVVWLSAYPSCVR